jgi:hypothetical protein
VKKYTGAALFGVALFGSIAILGTDVPAANAAADDYRTEIQVDCRCPDPVGQRLCAEFKNDVSSSAGYRLASGSGGSGIGVHLSSIDLWQGIDNQLAGTMSAASVTFTVYSDKLPGEVYEDSSVFRVGKDAVPDMSRKIIAAIGQLVSINTKLFQDLRKNPPAPAPAPSH